MNARNTRCTSHPAFEADYCPSCGTSQTIGANGATRTMHLAADTGNHGPACGMTNPAALTTGNPDEVTCTDCRAPHTHVNATTYTDAICAALAKVGVTSYLTTTGGGYMAIAVLHSGDQNTDVLITDDDGNLPVEGQPVLVGVCDAERDERITELAAPSVQDIVLAVLLATPLHTSEAATQWVYAMHAIGYGTHPDDYGTTIVKADGTRLFTDEQAALLDARMAEAFHLAGDVYLIALDAFEGGAQR